MTVLMRQYTDEPQKSSVRRASLIGLRIFVSHPWHFTAHSGRKWLISATAEGCGHYVTICLFRAVWLKVESRHHVM